MNIFHRYGSLGSCSQHSNVIQVPKRPPPLADDHTLVTPLVLNTSSSLNVTQDICYEIHNTDLVRIPQTYKVVSFAIIFISRLDSLKCMEIILTIFNSILLQSLNSI